jgi:hypothetical protein
MLNRNFIGILLVEGKFNQLAINVEFMMRIAPKLSIEELLAALLQKIELILVLLSSFLDRHYFFCS